MKKTNRSPLIQRVFISSTYEDMEEYRKIAIEALMSIEQMPIGMEGFIASTDTSLETCLSNVRRCQMLILLIGMQYGSIDKTTGKSYTELEYEEARRNNIPVLAFLMDETRCSVLPMHVDMGIAAEKLSDFKNHLKSNKYCTKFESKQDLKTKIALSVGNYFREKAESERNNKEKNLEISFEESIRVFREFLLLPERTKNTEVVLRVRMEGLFANSFLRREVFYEAYGLKAGDTIIAENVVPIEVKIDDISDEAGYMDVYAEGKSADWIIENGITTGIIFEGRFKLAYETVKGVASNRASSLPIDSKVPALILLEGLSVSGTSGKSIYEVRKESLYE